MNAIPLEWLKWVDENIERGVPPKTLIDRLIQNNFSPTLAAQIVMAKASGKPRPAQVAPVASVVQHVQNGDFIYEELGPKVDLSVKTTDREITVLMTINKPRVILFGNVFSKEECEQLIALSRPKISRSTTVDDASGRAEQHEHRTSSGTFFHINETPFIAMLDKRISELMQVPVANGEGLQILNYQVGGEYKPHFDYFPPEIPGSAVHIARGGQRVATLIIYLNTVDEGGETILPNIGLKVSPVQGNALYFAYTNSFSQVDPLTYHGGNPVIRGEKWITTKWVRQREYW
ncbi:MAG: 2OG-Fe(II) oxygenase [Candidatus Nitrotoga sp.]